MENPGIVVSMSSPPGPDRRPNERAFDEFKKTQDKRLDELEIRLNRPGVTAGAASAQQQIETKAWVNYLRRGREGMNDLVEVESLIIGEDPSGGYLTPPQFVTEMLKGLVEYSPVRQAAGRLDLGGGVILPKLTATPTANWEARSRTGLRPARLTARSKSRSRRPRATSTSPSACMKPSGCRCRRRGGERPRPRIWPARGPSVRQWRRHQKAARLHAGGGVGFVVNDHATAIQPDALISLVYSLPAFYRNRAAPGS